jgi:hypothetical protein
MVIIRMKLDDNIVAIYNKTAQDPFVMLDVNNDDSRLIEQIANSLNQSGIIYYAG